ncbi:MAG: hypothetical protein ACI92E_002646 [Oceanicoccus sp.]|jgi:hypothetical protein
MTAKLLPLTWFRMNLIRDTSNRNHAIAKALLVSCLLHGLIIATTSYLIYDNNKRQQPLVKPYRFKLNAHHQDEGSLQVKETKQLPRRPKRSTVGRLPQKRPASSRSNYRETNPTLATPRLDLSINEHENVSRTVAPQGGTTANGATIMNGELLEKLQNGKPHNQISERQELGPSTYNNSGFSQISTYTKIDGKCFLVSEPNPLDTFSFETWSRVKCR